MANGNFTPDAGEHESMDCDLCGDKMNVARGLTGPRTRMGALAKQHADILEAEPTFPDYDHFTCAHREEQCHKAAEHLKTRVAKEVSPSVRQLLATDLAQILLVRYYPEEPYVSAFS